MPAYTFLRPLRPPIHRVQAQPTCSSSTGVLKLMLNRLNLAFGASYSAYASSIVTVTAPSPEHTGLIHCKVDVIRRPLRQFERLLARLSWRLWYQARLIADHPIGCVEGGRVFWRNSDETETFVMERFGPVSYPWDPDRSFYRPAARTDSLCH